MNRHYAKLGDVWKHLPLAEILRLNPPRHYWESHAGSATYPLTPSPPRLHGALKFLAKAADDPQLADCVYLQVLRSMPGLYPGSSMLAMRMLNKSASFTFCDVDPNSAQTLREASGNLDVRVIEQDGVAAIARAAEDCSVDPSDVLVHIDPFDPHERLTPNSMTPVELAASLARKGYRVFYWYGYDDAFNRGWAKKEIADLAPGIDLWCGDALMPAPFIYPDRTGTWGCGIVMASMTPAATATASKLGRALERLCADDLSPDNDPTRLGFSEL